MTEDSSTDSCLVRVKAQVMTRDESSGGWIPMGGGGLSVVGLKKLTPAPSLPECQVTKIEYIIFGQRITDKSVVINCRLRKDVQYNKVTPTFHHWKTEGKKFGLTFQTAADARTFDRGMKRALDDLCDGSPDSAAGWTAEVGDDEVFMTLDLPLERDNSSSSSGSSKRSHVVQRPSSSPGDVMSHRHSNRHHLHRLHFVSRHQSVESNGHHNGHRLTSSSTPPGSDLQQQHHIAHVITKKPGVRGSSTTTSTSSTNTPPSNKDIEEIWIKQQQKKLKRDSHDPSITEGTESYSYVQFVKNRPSLHEYSYPNIDSIKVEKRSTSGSLRRAQAAASQVMAQPPLPRKAKGKDRKKQTSKHLLTENLRCKYCHEIFMQEENLRGACVDAPDPCTNVIKHATCVSCASCVFYHCFADTEGDYADNPCSCERVHGNHGAFYKRWTVLTLLALLLPCLWCYPICKACHRACVNCGVAGGHHQAT